MKENEHQPTRRKTKSRIPTFQSVEEEATFWDTHDSTAFENEWEDVTGKVKFVPARTKKGITVRLEDETLAKLKDEAKEKGIGPSTLARMWILERLKETHGT